MTSNSASRVRAWTTGIATAAALVLVTAAAASAYYLFAVDHRQDLQLNIGDWFGLQADLEVRFRDYEKQSLFVEAEDGVKLAVDVFIPTDGPDMQEKFPAVLTYGPYGRSYLYPHMTLRDRINAKLDRGYFGPVFDKATQKRTRVFLSQGYAVVAADMRGTGASEGSKMTLDPKLGLDGKHIVDWIAGQPWSNAKVCMHEQSYLGWSQFATAQHKPEALKCILPSHILFESFTEGSRPGGIAATRWLENYDLYLAASYSNDIGQHVVTTPVIDEDGDGRLADEIPIGYEGSDPVYADHDRRTQHHYARASSDRKDNLLVRHVLDAGYAGIDSVIEFDGREVGFYETSPGYFLKPIMDTDIAVYNIGGWFDGFVRGTTKLHATMQNRHPSRLFIAPRFHGGLTPAYQAYFEYDGDYWDQLTFESLRFVDYHLKGIDNGVSRETPVKIYVMHHGWREENEWPLARQVLTPFYFGGSRLLSASPAQDEPGVDRYTIDWDHRADYGSSRGNRWTMTQMPEQVMDRTTLDEKTYYYETPSLESDVEVTGHPVVNLWLASNYPDGDVHVYLTDVDQSGRSVLVTDGRLRVGWAGLANDDDQVMGVVDVKPDLPWHGYQSHQYDAVRMADGKTVNLRFDLEPTSWLFRRGHKIRVAIAGADHGNFELNETVCPEKALENCGDAVFLIHRSKDMQSNIELPVIPAVPLTASRHERAAARPAEIR